MLNVIKAITIILTLSSVLLVIYAIVTSTFTNILFWIIYFTIVLLDLALIKYLKKLDQP